MTGEEVSRDIEHAGAVFAGSLFAALWMFADVHTERSREFIQIGAVKESVRQAIDQPQRDFGSRCGQSFIQHDAFDDGVRNYRRGRA